MDQEWIKTATIVGTSLIFLATLIAWWWPEKQPPYIIRSHGRIVGGHRYAKKEKPNQRDEMPGLWD